MITCGKVAHIAGVSVITCVAEAGDDPPSVIASSIGVAAVHHAGLTDFVDHAGSVLVMKTSVA